MKNNQDLLAKHRDLVSKVLSVVRITVDHKAHGGKPRLIVSDLQNDPRPSIQVFEEDLHAFTAASVIKSAYDRQNRAVQVAFS